MKLMSPLLLDLWLLSNMAPGTDLSGSLETPTMLSVRCHDPGSARVLGDAWLGAGDSFSSPQESEPRVHARPEPALVSSSSRSGRAEPRSQPTRYRRAPWPYPTPPGRRAHHRWPEVSFPSGRSSMAQTMGESLLSWDWATIAATPRKSRTAPRSGVGSPGRFCADRASASAVAARGPGLFPSRRLDQAANTPAASRAAPRHAGRSDAGTALKRSTDLSTAATARRQSSG